MQIKGGSNNVTLLIFGSFQAVVLYHVHEYVQALSVLETLYQNIEPIDEVFVSYLVYSYDGLFSSFPSISAFVSCRE